MKEKVNYLRHIICLTALFVIGNAGIIIPFEKSDDTCLYTFIAAAAVFTVIAVILFPLIKRLYCENAAEYTGIKKQLTVILYVITVLLMLFTASLCFRDYTDFVSVTILPETPAFIISFIFFICISIFSIQKDSVILKFSVFAFLMSAAAVLIFFAVSLPTSKLENIILLRIPNFKNSLGQFSGQLLKIFLPIFPAIIYSALVIGKQSKKYMTTGLVSGSVIMLIMLLNSLLLFGADMASNLEYPYAAAISTVTIGDLFTRLDGFSYFLFFASCTVKITVLIAASSKLIMICGIKKRKTIALISAFIVFLAGVLL